MLRTWKQNNYPVFTRGLFFLNPNNQKSKQCILSQIFAEMNNFPLSLITIYDHKYTYYVHFNEKKKKKKSESLNVFHF